MDARRFNHHRETPEASLSQSNTTLPGLITLAVGVMIVITGLILLAAFGVPQDVSNNPEQLSGVTVLGVGCLVCLIGIVASVLLRKKALEEKREAKRRQREAQNQEEQLRKVSHGRVPPVPYTSAQYSTVSYMVNSRNQEFQSQYPDDDRCQAYNGYDEPVYPGQTYESNYS